MKISLKGLGKAFKFLRKFFRKVDQVEEVIKDLKSEPPSDPTPKTKSH